MQSQLGNRGIHQFVKEPSSQRVLDTEVEPGQILDDQLFMKQ